MADLNELKLVGTVKIKVRVLTNNDPSKWWGEMDTVTADKYNSIPPVYVIKRSQALDDELEFKGGARVYCLDDKERGLVAAWKA